MEGRRRITLYDQMTAGNNNSSSSSNRDSLASLMLEDVVFKNTEASRKLSRSRTLQDIIREEEPNNNNAKDRNSWRAFKEKLRLKRAIGSAWSSSISGNDNNNDHPDDNNNNNNDENNINLPQTRHDLDTSTQQNDAVAGDGNNLDRIEQFESNAVAGAGDSSEGENNHEAAVGVSLMDLLEETEQEMDLYRILSDDDDDVAEYKKGEEGEGEVEKEGLEEVGGLVEYNCCVCMVRHKGAAFIPCGHTFCRMCSREIWVSRGNCPLCNNLILEILDIF